MGKKRFLAEIQIRTLAMNFWATIEHSLNYKYRGDFPEDIQKRLKRAAEAAFYWMKKCQNTHEIQEAQRLFSEKKNQRIIEEKTNMKGWDKYEICHYV